MIQVNVVMREGSMEQHHKVSITQRATVAELKAAIAQSFHMATLAMNEHQLMFKQRVLLHEEQRLIECGIKDDALIRVQRQGSHASRRRDDTLMLHCLSIKRSHDVYTRVM